MENTMRIMIIIDGFFALQLYRKGISQGKKIIFPELVRYIVTLIEEKAKTQCIVTFLDCYIGYNQSPSPLELQFITELRNACVAVHGRQLRNNREKGIDSEIAWDVAVQTTLRTIDGIVLIAGDLDHITVVEKLKIRGLPTFLVSGTSETSKTRYSQELKSSCQEFFDIDILLQNPKVYKPNVVVKKKMNSSKISIIKKKPAKTPENLQSEIRAVISFLIKRKCILNGRRMKFVLQTEVITELNKRHITLPQSLEEYLASRPDVFRVGFQPYTNRRTVSCF